MRRNHKYLDKIKIADIISEAFDNALLDGKITRQQRRYFEFYIAQALAIDDLKPHWYRGHPHPQEIKNRIKRSLGHLCHHETPTTKE